MDISEDAQMAAWEDPKAAGAGRWKGPSSSSVCSSHQELEPQSPAVEVSDVSVLIFISLEKTGHPFPAALCLL